MSGGKVALLVSAGVLVAALAAAVILFVLRDRPEARSVDDAVEQFRASTSEGSTPADGAPPPFGVYELSGSGTESLSLPPISQSDGDIMPMTVAPAEGEGCWLLRIDYNEAHWQEWDLCSGAGGLVELGGRAFQRWDLGATALENLSTFNCDPPASFAPLDVEPGTAVERECTGTNEQIAGTTTSAGTVTYLGSGTVVVEGTEQPCRRYEHRREMSGGQSGTERVELCLATADLLPLRGERALRVETDSPVGAISYAEDGSWTLASITPRR